MATPPPESLLAALAGRVSALMNLTKNLAYARVDASLRVQEASENLANWLASSLDPFQDYPLLELAPEFFGAEEELERVLRGQLPIYQLEQVERQGSDGEVRYLTFHLVAAGEPLPAAGLIWIVEDVTRTSQLEQRLAQDRNELRLAQDRLTQANAELQRLSRQKSLFLSIAAHDLRAPLTAIAGYAGLAASRLPPASPPELNRFLAIIDQQVSWLDRLIDDLLDLDQIETGKISLQLQPCALEPLLQEVVEEMRILADQNHLALELAPAQDPCLILGDPRRVRQILFNLLSNAIKYTPEGGQVRVTAWEEQGCSVFQVQDSGPGIPAAESAHLFEPYRRLGEPGRYTARGSGLGLFIVKSLVEAQGGKIELASRPGEGTVFNVYLPRSPGEKEG